MYDMLTRDRATMWQKEYFELFIYWPNKSYVFKVYALFHLPTHNIDIAIVLWVKHG